LSDPGFLSSRDDVTMTMYNYRTWFIYMGTLLAKIFVTKWYYNKDDI